MIGWRRWSKQSELSSNGCKEGRRSANLVRRRKKEKNWSFNSSPMAVGTLRGDAEERRVELDTGLTVKPNKARWLEN